MNGGYRDRGRQIAAVAERLERARRRGARLDIEVERLRLRALVDALGNTLDEDATPLLCEPSDRWPV